jgi:orotidine-5'-phosphate decarboxylase
VTDPVHPHHHQLCIALDLDDLVAARRLAADLQPWFGVAKIGLELFSAAGSDAVATMIDLGYEVFLDLKLHDIPTTVGRSARILGAFGASYLTLHAHGGVDMLRAGVEGLRSGAAGAGLAEPVALAVTVLTSDTTAPSHIVPNRVRIALEGGCTGLVCAGSDVAAVRALAPGLMIVVPGIRPTGTPLDDQARVVTPRQAIDAGADLLVIGRPVTRHADPAAAAAEMVSGLR